MAIEREPFAFSDEEMNGLKQSVNTLDDNISPHAVNLTQEEYRWIYRMGPQALPFVEETLRCATEYPEFSQAFMDVAKFEKDFNFSRQTEELSNDLGPVLEKLTETSTAAGADAFKTARAYYESVKASAKANKPGADAILARLEKVFYRRKSTTPEQKPTTEESTNSEG